MYSINTLESTLNLVVLIYQGIVCILGGIRRLDICWDP